MARTKQTKRTIAMALATAIATSSTPVVVFAEEQCESNVTTSTESSNMPNGGTQTTTTTTTTTGTANAETGETGNNGSIEIKTEVTVKDSDGNIVENFTVTDGKSTETINMPDNGNESGQNSITLPLKSNETITNGEVIISTKIDGDLPSGEDDSDYDYTQTDEIDRTVIVETSGIEVEITETDAELDSVKPVYKPAGTDELYSDSGHFGITDGTTWKAIVNELVRMKNDGEITNEQYDALIKSSDGSDYVDGAITYNADGTVKDAKRNDANNFYDMMEDPIILKAIHNVLGEYNKAEGADADYCFVGSGNYSSQWVSKVYVTYVKDEATGEPAVDENGDYIIESITKSDGTVITVGGVPVTDLTPEYIESLGGDLSGVYDQKTGTRASQFMLMDKDGNIVFTHCVDIETDASKGKWYKIANLEDNDYYASEDAADHIRSIVMNGYWGTNDEVKEDGTYETGSMAKVKQSLLAALEKGDISDTVTISYKQDGQIVTEDIKVTAELLDGFTAGEATDVMQAAIWSYSNGASFAQDGKDGWSVGGSYYGDTINGQSNNHAQLVNDPAGMARMKLFYDWLIGLETKEETTTVINENNFGETFLTIGNKISSSEDGTRDTYQASLSFKAEFEVGENDELYVNLSYKDLEGNDQVVRKQLGQAGAEATDSVIVPNADNSYTLTDLALTENEDFTFDLRLEGVQQLQQSAYIFVSEGGVKDSQTFVGMAEGTNAVDVGIKVDFRFDVENGSIVKKHFWKKTSVNNQNTEAEDDTPPIDDNPVVDEDVTEDNEYTEDIEDVVTDKDIPVVDVTERPVINGAEEEAPLIAATGDSNHMTAGFGGMLAALAGMMMLKRRKYKQ